MKRPRSCQNPTRLHPTAISRSRERSLAAGRARPRCVLKCQACEREPARAHGAFPGLASHLGGWLEIGGSSLPELGCTRGAGTALCGRIWCRGVAAAKGWEMGEQKHLPGSPCAAHLGSSGKAAAKLRIEPRHLASPASAFSQSPRFLPARACCSVGGENVKTFSKPTSFGGAGRRGGAQTPGRGWGCVS